MRDSQESLHAMGDILSAPSTNPADQELPPEAEEADLKSAASTIVRDSEDEMVKKVMLDN